MAARANSKPVMTKPVARHERIVSFTPYTDGIGVQRDALTAKPQSFVTGDGWFTYNLVTNLAKLATG